MRRQFQRHATIAGVSTSYHPLSDMYILDPPVPPPYAPSQSSPANFIINSLRHTSLLAAPPDNINVH
jgi:hypothetical protein